MNLQLKLLRFNGSKAGLNLIEVGDPGKLTVVKTLNLIELIANRLEFRGNRFKRVFRLQDVKIFLGDFGEKVCQFAVILGFQLGLLLSRPDCELQMPAS